MNDVGHFCPLISNKNYKWDLSISQQLIVHSVTDEDDDKAGEHYFYWLPIIYRQTVD